MTWIEGHYECDNCRREMDEPACTATLETGSHEFSLHFCHWEDCEPSGEDSHTVSFNGFEIMVGKPIFTDEWPVRQDRKVAQSDAEEPEK